MAAPGAPTPPAYAGDALVAARLRAGDARALGEVLDADGAAVLAAAQRVLGDRSAAEDVLQDVLVAVWTHPERFDPARGSLRAYLCSAGTHHALDVRRSETRRVVRERRVVRLLPEQRGAPPATEREAEARVVANLVHDAVRSLPGEQREVVALAYFRGLSYREVAVVAGIPEGTAKSRLRLGLAKLGLALTPDLLETS